MKFNPVYHHRHSNRLKGYNYAKAGSYFVTVTCKNHLPQFGEIINGKMQLNEYGIVAEKEWLNTYNIRPNIGLGAFVVMPDHLHGIIIIKEDLQTSNIKIQETKEDKIIPKNEFGIYKGESNTLKNEIERGNGIKNTPK